MNTIGLYTFITRETQRFLRVFIQTLLSPWINALLYILIFGVVVGSRIESVGDVTYIDFVLPGILMLNLINASFSQTSSSLYFQRFARHIEEILVAPLSYFEMIVGYVVGGVVRGVVVSVGVYGIAVFFSAATIQHLGLFLLYTVAVAVVFSLLGLIVALWADNFEQLSVLSIFVITPLTFVGGVFNSISMLPEKIQTIALFNPFFYFVDGLRFSMVGIREGSALVGWVLILSLIFVLGGLVWRLFSIGWRLRT